jgi:hypothetical protein
MSTDLPPLLPCPFCGGPATRTYDNDPPYVGFDHAVICNGQTPCTGEMSAGTKEQATELWNYRVPCAAVAGAHESTPVAIEVDQGKLIVNSASAPPVQCKLVYVDMRSKRGEVSGWGDDELVPFVLLFPTEDSLHLADSDQESTQISFPEMKGWSVEMADLGRYTLRVLFKKASTQSTYPADVSKSSDEIDKRPAFEAWATRDGREYDLACDTDSHYLRQSTRTAWDAWEAATP